MKKILESLVKIKLLNFQNLKDYSLNIQKTKATKVN